MYLLYDLYGPVCNVFDQGDPLRWQVGGGWALEIESFLGPVKWHRADSAIGGSKNSGLPGPNPFPLALVMKLREILWPIHPSCAVK